MTRTDYWLEALNAGLEDIDKYDILNDTEKEQVAKCLTLSYDCIGMAFPGPGGYGVDKPREDPEITRLKEIIKNLEKERDDAIMSFKKNVSHRRGWDVQDVWVGDSGEAGLK